MKKTITMLVLTLLVFSLMPLALAEEVGKPETAGKPELISVETIDGDDSDDGLEIELIEVDEDEEDEVDDDEPKKEKTKAQIKEKVEKTEGVPRGLEVALTRVKNENAIARLKENMERFLEKYKARLESKEDVEVEGVDEETGAVKLKAKEKVRFLGFIKGRATKRYSVNAEGKIEEKAPWYRFLYREEVEVEEEGEDEDEEE